MPECHILICNKLGLHARASAKLVSTAGQFSSEIMLIKENMEVNAKSIMGIMMLAACKGTELTLKADGSDAEEAIAAIEQLVNDRFGEDA
ncbi:MAG TPA: HPr family phosphocarrier protein [Mariprofundaceae bacterium]|nr:HPr family phosphocarrier protein [Mariprofundaceae bacterium]